ncbi:HPP family protein [Methylocapsa acidiphila]|uniref:HPP family protein n=1 Tax=Methylocapsa acidiphila TaxID=133552 RepID=UPI000A00EBF5|nr:HPP family protein [Methylocapsa acidiphila]
MLNKGILTGIDSRGWSTFPVNAKVPIGNEAYPSRPPLRQVAIAFLGAFIAISVVAFAAAASQLPWVLGSFGASCFILFGFPDSPFAQPRCVIGGHFLASATGLIVLSLFGAHWWSMALAVAASIALMQLTRTAHPPAGSNAAIVMLSTPNWSFLIIPTLLGACALVTVAFVYNNFIVNRAYPKHWL